MDRYYVYTLSDPRDGRVFYVGKGQGQRMYQHEKEAVRGVSSVKCDRIRSILSEGYAVIVKVVKWFSDEGSAYAYERALIQRRKSTLTNAAPGHLFTENVSASTVLRRFMRTVKWLKAWRVQMEQYRSLPGFLYFEFPNIEQGQQKAESFMEEVNKIIAFHDSNSEVLNAN